MFELTINDQVYQFCFGMGFLRDINKTVSVPVDGAAGVSKNIGLRFAIANIIDGNIETLTDILDIANKGQSPRVTKKLLDAYIDDESTDIDALFEDVVGFLKNTNATKKATRGILEAVEKEKQKDA